MTDEFRLDEQDVYISYLPYAHIFEQVLYASAVVYGMRIGYFSGDVQKIVSDDLPVLQPTFFPLSQDYLIDCMASSKTNSRQALAARAGCCNRL